MRKVSVLNFVFIISILIFTRVGYGEELTVDVPEDGWVKETVIAVEPVNIGKPEISVPLSKCDVNGKNCKRTGTFKHTLSSEEISQLSWHLYEKLISSRFNKIILGSDISTATSGEEAFSVTIPELPVFEPSGEKRFRAELQEYIPEILKVVETTVNEFFHGMSEEEQEKYIQKKSEKTGLHPRLIPLFMNTVYLFAVNIIHLKAEGIIVPIEGVGYELRLKVNMTADIYIYSYDRYNNDYVYSQRERVSSTERLAKRLGFPDKSSYTALFSEMPDQESPEIESLWKRSLQSTINAVGVTGRYKLRRKREFSIYAPVRSVYGSNIEAQCGRFEDVRVDQPMAIVGQEKGSVYTAGYAKARKIGDNCSNKDNLTRFRRIQGFATEEDMLHEIPWSGVMISAGGGINQFALSFWESDQLLKLGGIYGGSHVELNMNLGYISNLSFLSETWLSFGGFVYASGKNIVGYYRYPVLGGGYLGLSRRIYMTGGGVFLAPNFRFGVIAGGALASKYNPNEGDLIFGSLFVEPALQLGFTFTPGFEMSVQGGYQFPLAGRLYKDKVRIADSTVAFKSGFTTLISFHIHLPVFRGAAASRALSKTSRHCRNKPGYSELLPGERPLPLPEIEKEEKEEKETVPEKEEPEIVDISELIPPPFDKSKVEVIDILHINPEVIVAYDEAVHIESGENVHQNSTDAIDAWKKVVEMEGENPFLEIAEKRLFLWLKYHLAKGKELEMKKNALENISTILPLASISDEQKLHAVIQYFEKYGTKYGISSVMEILSDSQDQETVLKILNDPAFDTVLKKTISARCDIDDAEACYTYGKTFPAESEEREKLLEKACGLDFIKACRELKGEEEYPEDEEEEAEPEDLENLYEYQYDY